MSLSLPIHPRTGLRAVGIVGGRPVWPILGGSSPEPPAPNDPAPPAGDPPANQPPPAPSDPEPKPQGEPAPKTAEDVAKLQQALERERALRKDAEKRAKDGDAARSKLDELENASKTEVEKAVEAARREGAAQALAAANARLIASEARALAAQAKFRNAADAVPFLDLSEVRVAEDGTVDTAAISRQLDELAKAKPYLLAAEEGPRTPKPDPSQGGRSPGAASSSVGRGRELFQARRKPARNT